MLAMSWWMPRQLKCFFSVKTAWTEAGIAKISLIKAHL